ncbi:DUF3880 domain-containing protein [Lachnospiraceae bacterium ZAX-1]
MNILFLDWPCFGKIDAIFSLQQAGHNLTMFFHDNYQDRISTSFDTYFAGIATQKKFDFCFSFNFYPVLSENCKKHCLKYVSIVYDSPYVALYSYTIINPNNYIFIFDSQEYLKLQKMGISTVHYLPLPVNATIIDFLQKKGFNRKKSTCDVSFVGALYNEDHNFFERLTGVNDYTRGYLDAIMEAQIKIYGYNFIEDALTPNIISELKRVADYGTDAYGIETAEYIYANYFIARKITSIDRQRTLTAIAKKFPLKLFTLNKDAVIPNALNMGAVDYYSEMPYVFANSKINLNITLRSIQSGIPLRAMDIMGAGGFLLTNYQADFLNYFVPDEDFVYYTDIDDLLQKIDYYLHHEDRRKQIAKNGHQKVKENHNFDKCFKEIFSIVFQHD